MNHNNITNEYFDWLTDMVCKDRYDGEQTYYKLLSYLHNRTFEYTMSRDVNRAVDGMNMRYIYARHSKYNEEYEEVIQLLSGPCSVLEMMVGLSFRCEEQIMHDPDIGDRTGQWFWRMVINLGLGPMIDINFDSDIVEKAIDKFLNREYEPDGRGGLFTVKDADDMCDVEIWRQLMRYLNTIN